MTIDLDPFKKFLSSLSRISRLNFQVWDGNGLVFASGDHRAEGSNLKEHQTFSAEVMGQGAYQYAPCKSRYLMWGTPLKYGKGEEVVGALIAYGLSSHKEAHPGEILAQKTSHAREMETFLTHLAGLMEETWATGNEADEMAEELAQNLENLSLYGRISSKIKTLKFSRAMLESLLEEVRESVRVDLAFVEMPNRQEYNTLVSARELSDKIPDQKSFVNDLIGSIPQKELCLKEDYFIVNDSSITPGYMGLHPDPYRFLAVKVQHNGNFDGWLGLVSFNLKEVFLLGELRLLTSIAEQVSVLMANVDLYRDLNQEMEERKQAEEEQKRLETQLQRAQKMEAIGTLAGGVAHDLNNVLSALVTYPELLLMEIPEDSPLRKPLLTMQKSGEKAAAIVQDLLTLARRGVFVEKVMNLNHIVSEYLISPEYGNLKDFHPNVKVETELKEDLLHVLGSPVHLSKTVMNLVSNAHEAMPDGGTILISTENRYVDQRIRGYDDVQGGDYVVLTVSDTGVGISSEDMERIFEPFYTKKVMGKSGTGLGMAVVWGTVKDHKGYIDIESTEGKGTTFTLYFPVTRKEPASDKAALYIEDYMGKGESILLVDDIEEQRDMGSRILKKLGYTVTLVSSGEEAVDYLKNNSVDLLVLDMIMDPGIDGCETYKRILELHPKQKAIIVSGFSETDRVKEAQRLGAGAYVKKPFLLEKIGLAVRDELDR